MMERYYDMENEIYTYRKVKEPKRRKLIRLGLVGTGALGTGIALKLFYDMIEEASANTPRFVTGGTAPPYLEEDQVWIRPVDWKRK